MKTVIKSSVLFLGMLFFICEIALAVGPPKAVDPNPYTIIMKKVRLRDSTTQEWVTVGEGDLSINIASVNAGELAAGYVDASAVPEGTYDKIEVTLSRDMTIKASYADTVDYVGGGTTAIYYTTSALNNDNSLLTSTNSNNYTEGTSKVPEDTIGVDVTANTYTKEYDVPSPGTITASKGSTRRIRIKFDVTGAALFQRTNPGVAAAYPKEPSVEMEIIE